MPTSPVLAPESPDDDEELAPAPRRFRLSVGAAVVVGLIVLSAIVGAALVQGQVRPAEAIEWDAVEETGAPRGAEAYVHVLGEVVNPGLYVLGADARVADALAAAGGTTETADLQSINLARLVSDGEQLVVAALGAPGAATVPGATSDGMIDLNTADSAALEELPRIGPAIAERIIAWREENGRFQSVDDLLAVPGIGEKLLAGLRSKVRV